MKASPLTDVVKHGSIGPIWCEGRELIRRLFVTVRDERWQEVAPAEWVSEYDALSESVSISARHSSDLVDFAWRGSLKLAPRGHGLSFEFTGRALRDMKVCRLGLVILHPVEWIVGSDVYTQQLNSEVPLRLSNKVAPQPIVKGLPTDLTEPFSRLRIENLGLGKLEFRFEGESFELEDQRNWGDASFKTYCTPLRLGFPRAVESGTSISHRVQVSFEPSATHTLPTIESRQTRVPFPKIGRKWSYTDEKDDAPSPHRSHIQFRIADNESSAELEKLLMQIPTSTSLEVAIEPQQNARALREILSRLSEHKQRIERLLVFGDISEEFRALDDVLVLAATHGYFVEFNRGTPLSYHLSGIAFPLTATVHSDDADTIVDNVATIRDIADSARKLLPNPSIALAPLALYHPKPQPPREFPAHLAKPRLVASIIEAALASGTSITLDDDAVRELFKCPVPSQELSLSDLVECSDMQVIPVDSELSTGVHAVLIDAAPGGPKRLLAANLSTSLQELTISTSKIELPAYGTRSISLVI